MVIGLFMDTQEDVLQWVDVHTHQTHLLVYRASPCRDGIPERRAIKEEMQRFYV